MWSQPKQAAVSPRWTASPTLLWCGRRVFGKPADRPRGLECSRRAGRDPHFDATPAIAAALAARSDAWPAALPIATDIAAVRENVLSAMSHGDVVEVVVDVPADTHHGRTTTPLLVNGASLVTAAVIEAPASS